MPNQQTAGGARRCGLVNRKFESGQKRFDSGPLGLIVFQVQPLTQELALNDQLKSLLQQFVGGKGRVQKDYVEGLAGLA